MLRQAIGRRDNWVRGVLRGGERIERIGIEEDGRIDLLSIERIAYRRLDWLIMGRQRPIFDATGGKEPTLAA